MKRLLAAFLAMLCACLQEASASGHPRSQVTFRVHDTNVALLVKSTALSHAGRGPNGKRATLFWSGRVEDDGTVILHDPSPSHPYVVMLRGPPGARPELSVDFEGLNIGRSTIGIQPPLSADGTARISLWFMIHNGLATIVPDRSSHELPPPRPEDPRVQPGEGKDRFVLLWKQPRFMGMTNDVDFDVRWSTGRVSEAEWGRAERATNTAGLQQAGESWWMDVSPLVSAGARSFAIRAIDPRSQDSPVSEPALVDSDADGMPDVWEAERWGNLSMDASTDTDKDHVPDYMEAVGLDPDNPDSDGDGLPDGWEMGNYLDPRKPDSSIDSDGDRFSNLEEYKAGTDAWDSSSHPDAKRPENP